MINIGYYKGFNWWNHWKHLSWCIASASVFFCNLNLCARSNGGLHAGSPRIALVFSNKSRYAFTPFSYRDIQRIQHVFQGKSNKANPYNYWLYIWLYVQYITIRTYSWMLYIYILYRESFKMPGFIFGKDHPLNTGLLTAGCCARPGQAAVIFFSVWIWSDDTPQSLKVDAGDRLISNVPSGYVKIAIENGHRNSGCSH